MVVAYPCSLLHSPVPFVLVPEMSHPTRVLGDIPGTFLIHDLISQSRTRTKDESNVAMPPNPLRGTKSFVILMITP
jgi:hypothetical protein